MRIACPACQTLCDVGDPSAGTEARCRCGTLLPVPPTGTDAGKLDCPRCGAPVAEEDTRCRYCECAVAAVGCHACFGRVFVGARHCGHCGSAIRAETAGDRSSSARTCPRCAPDNSSLVAHRVSATLLEECAVCGGVWLEAAAFQRLIRTRDEQAAVVSTMGPRASAGHVGGQALQVRYVRCPDCRQLMNRKNFAHTSGVIVDECHAHGVWFDRDELGRIVAFVMNGGLEAARRAEAERFERRIERASVLTFHAAAPEDGTGTTVYDVLEMLANWIRRASRWPPRD